MIAVIKCLMLIDVLHLSCKGGVFGDNSGIIFFLFLHNNICCGYSLEVIMQTHLFKYIEISPPKTENFQIKNSDIFIFLLKT